MSLYCNDIKIANKILACQQMINEQGLDKKNARHYMKLEKRPNCR